MAKNDNKKRGTVPEHPRWSNEVLGIVLIAVGILLFLSLLSYAPSQLPKFSWTWLDGQLEPFTHDDGAHRHNWIGPLGATAAFAQILMFGAGAYLIPVG